MSTEDKATVEFETIDSSTSSDHDSEISKKSIVVPISEYTKEMSETFYRNYFDLEGGTFPDLFGCDVQDKKDCLSYVRYVATPRSARIYTNLLNGVIREATSAKSYGGLTQEQKAEKLRNVIEQFTKTYSQTRQK